MVPQSGTSISAVNSISIPAVTSNKLIILGIAVVHISCPVMSVKDMGNGQKKTILIRTWAMGGDGA